MFRITLLLSLVFTLHAEGQSCLPANLTLSRQGQIDSFSIQYPGCTDIDVVLTIYSNNIKNLHGLSHIKSISGRLRLLNTNIISLTDLESLEKISQLELLYNSKLQNLERINVDSIDYLHLETNPITNLDALSVVKYIRVLTLELMSIQNLNAFSNLEDYEYLELLNMTNLPNLNGWPQISSSQHERTIEISSCTALTSLQGAGYSGVTHLELRYNPLLTDVSAIGNMSGLKSLLCIQNDGLIKITGLQDLTQFEDLSVVSNTNLTSLDGPEAITDMLTFELLGNPKLSIVNGFRNVRTMKNLHIKSTPLSNLDALPSVDSIYNNLLIEQTPQLGDISALTGLRYVGGNLNLQYTGLNSLAGLDSLDYVGSTFYLGFNNNMLSLDGLKSIAHVGNTLSLEYMVQIQNLESLTSLHYLGGLVLSIVPHLHSLDGLESLDTINGDLSILNDDGLESLTALHDLNYIYGVLTISGNEILPSLNGLDSFIWHKISNIIIKDNPSLMICVTPAVCIYLGKNKPSDISNNAIGCQSADEVINLCGTLSTNGVFKNQVILYPNPTSGSVYLTSDYIINCITVQDVRGIPLMKIDLPNDEIDLSQYPAGIYFVQIQMDEGVVMKRVVKN